MTDVTDESLDSPPCLTDTHTMSHLTPATPRGRSRRQSAIAAAAPELPSPAEMIDAILDTVGRASDETVAEGLGWYPAAHSLAADMATRHGLPVDTAAGIVAAMSPQTGWAENIRLADQACEHVAAGQSDLIDGHLADACAKASRIGQGEHPTDVLGGRKVRSFYANIARPLAPGAVTIDRHAVSVILGRRCTEAEYKSLTGRVGLYARIAAAYRSAARIIGIRPHECQAIAWCQWRAETDIAYRYDPSF